MLDVRGSGTLEPLSIRKGRSHRHRPCIEFSVFDDDDGHKRGQTSRPDVGTEIQTNCHFEARVYYCNYLLGFYPCGLFKWIILSPYNLSVQLPSYIILPGNIIRIVHKDFLHSQISSSTSRRSTTDEPNKCTEHGAIQKAVYSALWVQLALVVCYAPLCTVNIVIAHTKKYSFLLFVIYKVAIILLCFNSTLNPFLYCWKISEVRQAVKQTIREALC